MFRLNDMILVSAFDVSIVFFIVFLKVKSGNLVKFQCTYFLIINIDALSRVDASC